MTSRPHILLVIPTLIMGGAQRVFHDHSVLLAEHFPVEEVVFNLDGGCMFPSGNPLTSLDVGGGGGSITKIANFLRRISRLRRIKQAKHIDVSISHLEGADYVNILSRGGEKTILVVHGSKLADHSMVGLWKALRQKLLIPWLYRRADRVVTVSHAILTELVSLGLARDKLITINNFFDIDGISKQARKPLERAEQALYDAAPVLITSGRLSTQKHQKPLFEIFAQLLNRQAAKLILLGDGELREELMAHSRAQGLRTWDSWSGTPLTPDWDVYFFGAKQNPFKYIHRASVFVFPSNWEGFPLALCEAMICGVPVVSTDCPTGPREILAPHTEPPPRKLAVGERAEFGVLMPLLDDAPTHDARVKLWSETIANLLNDPEERRRLGVAAAARMQDFSKERIARQWITLIDEVAAT